MREEAPSVLRASARNPRPPLLRSEEGNLDGDQATVRCLHHAEHRRGGLQRSCKTEGALLRAQAFGALLREAFVVFEARDETAETGPAGLWRAT